MLCHAMPPPPPLHPATCHGCVGVMAHHASFLALPSLCPPPQFLLKTKSIDHNDVPMFFKLFHSGDVHSFRKARLWCLHLLFRSLQVGPCW